jgi:hypothetical protein
MERKRRANVALNERALGLFELCKLDPSAQVDFIQNPLKRGIDKAFPPFGDGQSQPAKGNARDSAGQEAIADLIEQRQKLFTMMNAAPAAVGGILNALKRQDGIDCGDGATASQSGGGLGVGNFLGGEALALGRRCAAGPPCG